MIALAPTEQFMLYHLTVGVMDSIRSLVDLLKEKGPMTTHGLYDLNDHNLSLTCLKGLLHEAEVNKLIKFNSEDKTWSYNNAN